jgi:isochorismate pyruvate lyase
VSEPLAEARRELDALDDAILSLLAQRAGRVAALAAWKQANGVPLRDPAREAQVLDRLAARARASGLDGEAVRAVFARVVGVRLDR